MQAVKREPGAELDRVFAKLVEGYRVILAARAWTDDDWRCADRPTQENAWAIDTSATPERFPGSGAFHVCIPPHSTNDGLAVAALIRFAEQHGCMWRLWQVPPHLTALQVDGKFGCTICGGDLVYEDMSLERSRTGESPAHAAVLAMLDAVEAGRAI